MKTKLPAFAVLAALLAAVQGLAAPLTSTTAVHTKPDAASPAFSYLKAGTEPTPAAAEMANTPAGWMAVEMPGPFTGWVQNRDLTKGLDPKPGTPIRLSPDAKAGVLAIAEAGDKTTITGLQGRWTQLTLDRPMVGYIQVGSAPGYLPPVATTPATNNPATTSFPLATPESSVPVMTPAAPTTMAGQPAPPSSAVDSANLPRQLTGRFVSTRHPLRPRRPYEWALEDNNGRRFAYVDTSKLLLTEQIDKYVGHFVVVFGAAKPTPDGKEIVIQTDSLQLLLR